MGEMADLYEQFLNEREEDTGQHIGYRTYMHQDFVNWLCGNHPLHYIEGQEEADEQNAKWREQLKHTKSGGSPCD